MSEVKQGTFIHGIAASEHIDSSGERIKVEGIDISSLTKDGTFNYEHDSKSASSLVGKIFEAKKIIKASDCENENHTYFWNKLQMPFLYVAGELFDGVGHSEAENVAAMLRYDQKAQKNEENRKLINFSIEGSSLTKRGSNILKCIARKISITITPCNKVCEAEEMKEGSSKKSTKKAATEDFSFIQDIMMEKGEHVSSCRILKSEEVSKTNWGEMGFINTNIKSEKKAEKTLATKVRRRAKDRVERYKRRQRVKRTPSRQAPIKPQQPRQPRADRQVIADEKRVVRKSLNKKQGVPKGANPAVHERCVRHLKDQGHDKGSSFAICNAAGAGKKKKKRLGKYESNMRKAITAGAGMGSAPSTKVQGEALQKEILTSMVNTSSGVRLPSKAGSFKKSKKRAKLNKRAEEAFKSFSKKEELIDFLSQKLPTICDAERLALAKAVAYICEKKRETSLAKLLKADIIDFKTRKTLHKDPNQQLASKKKDINPASPKSRPAAQQLSIVKNPKLEQEKLPKQGGKAGGKSGTAIRYGTYSGNFWVYKVKHEDGSVTHSAHTDKNTAREKALNNEEPGHVGHGNFMPTLENPSGNKPMLVVGTNTYLRNKLPWAANQNHDHYIFYEPQKSGKNDRHHVGVLAVGRDNLAVKHTHAYSDTSQKAMESALHQMILEHHKNKDVASFGKQFKVGDPQSDIKRKRLLWLTNGVYRTPKISIKDVHSLSPEKKRSNE